MDESDIWGHCEWGGSWWVQQGSCTTLLAWVKEVSGYWPSATAGKVLCVERMAVTQWLGREKKGKTTDKDLRKAFPADCPRILLKEPLTNLCCPPIQGFLYQAMAHPEPQILTTHLLHHSIASLFFFFSPLPSFCLFVCLNAQAPQLSSLSLLIRETKILCYGATFWDKKGRLLITNLLDCWNQSLT